MPKRVDRALEKRNIIHAFQRCCLVKPMNSVTVRDIASEAGISHAKLLSYFGSKEEVIISYAKHIAELYSKGFESTLQGVAEQGGSKTDLLISLIRKLYELDEGNVVEKLYAQIYILGQYNDRMRSVVLEAYSDWRRSILATLREIRPDFSESLARSALVLIEGILIYRMNDDLSLEEAEGIVYDVFVDKEA